MKNLIYSALVALAVGFAASLAVASGYDPVAGVAAEQISPHFNCVVIGLNGGQRNSVGSLGSFLNVSAKDQKDAILKVWNDLKDGKTDKAKLIDETYGFDNVQEILCDPSEGRTYGE